MALPGPFLAGQRLTAGQLNDATQKTLASVDANVGSPGTGILVSGVGATETNITQFVLGPFDQVDGGLYRVNTRVIREQTVATNEFRLIMRKNVPLVGAIVADWNMWGTPDPNLAQLFTGWAHYSAIANESVTYFFSVVRSSGAGTLTVYGHHTSNTPSGVSIERNGYGSEFQVVT